ncbi:MAG: NAD-dependent epimerase/dehydratase family protein [Thermoanaerobaculia bacterium]
MTSRLALLTGATGFLGGHVARALLEEGWRVRALARSDPAGSPLLADLPLEIIRGDLSQRTDLAAAAAGCEAIVHVAGLVKARTLEDYREVNRRGTERLVEAAGRTAPGAMWVLVSSQAAAGPARSGRPVTPSDPARPVSWYGASKLEGEQAVQRGWKGPWIILRPGVIYGPGDQGLLTLFRMARAGWIPLPAASSRIQIGAAEQISLAIARAAGRRDLSGRTAFLCDPLPVSVGRLGELVACLPPRRARLVPVPALLVQAAGLAETLREAVTRRSRPFNADKARELLAGEWLCESGLRQELGLPAPVPLESGLRAAWDWYRKQGWLIL